ncbi:hypothetical protein BaRGS_00009685 [Batillaria attramentaria]|uniref:TRAF-type domain-containing protein n=1 Tax=Batillaria attramentaria TaxID=370345 RepID=A0ABD0LJ14_9CAEN
MSASENETETKYCSNCKKDIAAANFTMHEVHCRRHLVLCQHCEEPVPRSELDQHFNDVHAKVACTLCGTEIEKDQLDTHMEADCTKRNVPCEYCELEMPHAELAEHLEYCHGADGDGRGPMDERAFREFFGFGTEQLSTSFDPFTFEEIRQALGPGMGGDTSERSMPSLPLEDSDASAAAGERAMVVDMSKRPSKNIRLPVRKNDSRSRVPGPRSDQRGPRNVVSTNKRSNLNRQTQRDTEPAIPPDMDYDTMLAMQLAAEDTTDPDPDAHLNQLINNFEKRSRQHVRRTPSQDDDVVVPASPPDQNDFDAADEDMIPCEFCGETFPAFALSVCDPLASGLWGNGEDVSPAFGRNNEPSRWRPVDSRPAIPVINNLGSASPASEAEVRESYHLTDNGDYLLNSLENIMLPCEFCSELLPADFLVQHQAICEGNSSSTPRVMTPAAAQPSSGFAPGGPRNQFFPTSPTRSRQRQADPTEELWSSINRRGEEENEPASNPTAPKKRLNAPKGPKPSSRHIPASVARHGGEDASSRSMQGGRSSRRPVEEEHQSDMLVHARGTKPPGQSRSDNSNRTRHTLDRLLSDEDGVGQRNSGPRQKAPSTRSTGVSSRSVMQTMRQEQRQRNSRRPSADQEPSDEMAVDMGDRRQRERDRVFNGLDNARSPPNQSRPRRSANRQVPE